MTVSFVSISEWISNTLNRNTKSIKPIGKMHRKHLSLGIGKYFLDKVQKYWKHKNSNLDFIKILNSCSLISLIDTTHKIQRQALQWKNRFIAHWSRDLSPE